MVRLVIGNKNYSSWSLRPWLLMRHFGVLFEELMLPLDTPDFRERIVRYSPTGRVPVLNVGEEVIWDSLAICEVVNERFLSGRAWPGATMARAAARCASAEMHAGFAALRAQLPMNCRREATPPHWDANAGRDIARVQQLWGDLRRQYGASGNFLAGEFGIVDAMFAPVCIRFRVYGVATDETSSAYIEAVYALPAMREWLAAARDEPERLVATDDVGLAVSGD